MARAIGAATMKWSGPRATARGIIGFTANTSAGNSVGTTGKTVMMIDKTTSATATADKLATLKANYEKTYYRYLALFNGGGRHADFVCVG